MVRFKQRYIVSEMMPETGRALKFTKSNHHLKKAIMDKIQQLYGDYGHAVMSTSFRIMYLHPVSKSCIIRIARGYHQQLITALTLLTEEIQGQKLVFRSLHIAGSLRLCQKFLVKYNQNKLRELLKGMDCQDESERQKVKKQLAETGLELNEEPDMLEEDE